MEGVVRKINEIFNNPKIRSTFVTYRVPLAVVFAIFIIYLMKKEYFWAGFWVSIIGEAIQVWCFASISKNKELSTKGPYSIMRNPMYIGRYVMILGAIIATGSMAFIVIYTVIYYFYMVNRVKREETVLIEIFGEEYLDYCKRVSRFVPSIAKLSLKNILYFHWDLFFKNHAHLNILAVLIFYAIAYLSVFHGEYLKHLIGF